MAADFSFISGDDIYGQQEYARSDCGDVHRVQKLDNRPGSADGEEIIQSALVYAQVDRIPTHRPQFG